MNKFVAILLALFCSTITFAQNNEFSTAVDMSPWSDSVAVFTDGRVKSFETFARSYMPFIMGSKKFESQDATFTYFDMLIRPERYVDQDIIFVKHKGLRAAIIDRGRYHRPRSSSSTYGCLYEKRTCFKRDFARGISSWFAEQIFVKMSAGSLLQLNKSRVQLVQAIHKISGTDSKSFRHHLANLISHGGSSDQQRIAILCLRGKNSLSRGKMKTQQRSTPNSKYFQCYFPHLQMALTFIRPSSKLRLESFYFRMGNFTSYLVGIPCEYCLASHGIYLSL